MKMEPIIDYYNNLGINRDKVLDLCLVDSRNYILVPEMLLKLSGHGSQYMYISEPLVAKMLYERAKEEIQRMGLTHVFLYDIRDEGNVEAVMVVVKYQTVADLHTKVSGARPPPTGPNSFVFTYVFTKKHLCWRLAPPPMRVGAPPTGNPGSAPAKEPNYRKQD